MENLTNGVINVHVNPKDKEEATNILKDLGLNMTTLINMTLKQVIKRNGIPFEVTNPTPSKELLEAIEEGENILGGKVKTKKYHSVKELIGDLENDL